MLYVGVAAIAAVVLLILLFDFAVLLYCYNMNCFGNSVFLLLLFNTVVVLLLAVLLSCVTLLLYCFC